jgi:hypothetical protein
VPGADDPGKQYENQYAVSVLCASEAEQQRTFDALTAQGFACKILVV